MQWLGPGSRGLLAVLVSLTAWVRGRREAGTSTGTVTTGMIWQAMWRLSLPTRWKQTQTGYQRREAAVFICHQCRGQTAAAIVTASEFPPKPAEPGTNFYGHSVRIEIFLRFDHLPASHNFEYGYCESFSYRSSSVIQ